MFPRPPRDGRESQLTIASQAWFANPPSISNLPYLLDGRGEITLMSSGGFETSLFCITNNSMRATQYSNVSRRLMTSPLPRRGGASGFPLSRDPTSQSKRDGPIVVASLRRH